MVRLVKIMAKKRKKNSENNEGHPKVKNSRNYKKRAKDSIRKRIEEWTDEWGIQE